MWFVGLIALAACEPGPAYWMPHTSLADGETGALAVQSRQRIACCHGNLGAVPVDSSAVEGVYEHRDTYYAILAAETTRIECPPFSNPWTVEKNSSAAPRSRSRRSEEIKIAAPTSGIEGFTAEQHSSCVPYSTARAPLGQCAAACGRESRCGGFVHHAGAGGSHCGLCAMGTKGTRHIRASSGQTVYVRHRRVPVDGQKSNGLHHPIWLAGGLFGVGAGIALAVSVYGS